MTLEELFKECPVVKPLYDEAGAYRVVNVKTGAKCRTFSKEMALDASLYKPDPDFCGQQLWHGLPGDNGALGLRYLLKKNVPSALLEFAERAVKGNLRPCQHDSGEVYLHLDTDGNTTDEICTDENCTRTHFCEVRGVDHSYDYPVEPPTTKPGWESLKRNLNICHFCGKEHPAGWGGLLERMRHAAGGPAPEILSADGWHTSTGKPINDLKQPLYVVRSCEEGLALSERLEIIKRWRTGKLSRWYVENCFYVCNAEAREALMDMNLTKTTVTGALGWKPVVLTFIDAEVERKLSQVCKQVVTVPPVQGRDYLAEVLDALKTIEEPEALANDDMSAEVLDGWLGEVCRSRMLEDYPLAYAWPALLTAASVLVNKDVSPTFRANLFTGIIGPVGSGKTCVFNDAFRLLGLRDDARAEVADTEVVRLKAGSGEGLSQKIGDQNAASKLVFVDELQHLLNKVNIKGSTFANTLDDSYTTDVQRAIVEHRKEILFSVRLSLAGGIPEEGFAETFGAGTTTGLHSRFMLAVCPTSFPGYSWHPPEGRPALERNGVDGEPSMEITRPTYIEIASDVWAEKKRWQRELKLDGRAVEMAMKAAIIAAAFDNRGTLTAAQLGPALAFARYQDAMHRRFAPNPGKNGDAIVVHDALTYLRQHAAAGQWIPLIPMLDKIHAYRQGAGTVNRALAALRDNGEIELGKTGRKRIIRLCLDTR